MSPRLKKISTTIIIIGFFALIGLSVLINVIARNYFRTQSFDEMEMTARIKRASFEASMNEQLALVLQMVKMPSIKEHLKNPADEIIRENALKTSELLWVHSSQTPYSGFLTKTATSGTIWNLHIR